MAVDIQFASSTWEDEFLKRIGADGPWVSWELFQLAVEGEKNLLIETFDGLLAPSHLPHLTPLPHQLDAVTQVIEQMNGKAILADEVGLGKTIEAGLILKEYMIRGLVKRALILVPASLVTQWATELNEKFLIPAVIHRKNYMWDETDVIISSIDTAKRSPHKEMIYEQDFDLIIIDEAHKLKNNKTKNYEFILHLKKKFCLLLTATPIQNRVEEIFNLVSLLKPGHLGSEANFLKKYKKTDRSIHDDAHLKQLINQVMVRNRRADTGIEWSKRHVETVTIDVSPEERTLYEAISTLMHDRQLTETSPFSVLTLQREACSSREAVFHTLHNMLKKREHSSQLFRERIENLLQLVETVTTNSKAEKAVEFIKSINDKVIIFTEYRATQVYLQWFLKQHGITSVPFRGGFKSGKKDWMRELFKNQAQVLIATEAGGEGINLQFCHHVINYDLPWNPMRLEQRIGRVHRLGQEHDVHIYNFMTKGTIEEHIVTLLYEKIHLFERVVGELDDILMRMELGNFEEQLQDIFSTSTSDGEARVKMENLTAIIDFADEQRGSEQHATT